MYRGYKNKRAYHNSKIHGMLSIIYGEDYRINLESIIRNILSSREGSFIVNGRAISLTLLTNDEAELVYKNLITITKKTEQNKKDAEKLLKIKSTGITENQCNCIVKIAIHTLGWSYPALFSYILEMYPDKRRRLNSWEIQKSKIRKLFSITNCKEADRIIKRLDKIQERNSTHDLSREHPSKGN